MRSRGDGHGLCMCVCEQLCRRAYVRGAVERYRAWGCACRAGARRPAVHGGVECQARCKRHSGCTARSIARLYCKEYCKAVLQGCTKNCTAVRWGGTARTRAPSSTLEATRVTP